ncbi:hypothetical protein BDP81DRAFT_466477 [Colletotrichum phormii]|uniref:Isopenicillin N synthase-like Fe(2+) 2OG dioxygenase domain-containing protein n=1 Tax=Colletotrichum phormii TaxID=359342 RepID=A0AAI9ZCR2_9PEZI|nr:uncharacterized protein BDP81DRAFT_466477 [Colletotrichum phormii]KAK1621892.1 hypothetical protein BDP81DRAFT_466477 [Colletotrichum phormii]
MRLQVLNYERLKAGDNGEIEKLGRASRSAGVFFLDLRGPSTEKVLADLQPIVHAQRRFFAQESKMKLGYASNLENHGYDCSDETCVQRLKLSRSEQIRGTLDLPADLRTVEAKIENVASSVDTVLRDLSTLLCESLDPPVLTSSFNNAEGPGLSNMCLGLATTPAGTSLMDSHLDEDLLTITFYDEPFLEVLEPLTGEWKVVEVLENMPIVNVGDSFQQLSNNRLHAPLHRVKQPDEEINLIMYDLCQGGQN